jgi:hypothetical protein
MAIKAQNETLAKSADDEEIFVLRGRDLSAPQTVAFWIAQNITNEACPDEKLREALECALRMRRTAQRRAAD